MTIEQLSNFLAWCTLINLAMLTVSSVALICFRKAITAIHAKLTGVDESALPAQYFRYLANYKLLVLNFNLVPYLALRLFM